MTGYGKHVIQLPSKKITVELKSLNSKNIDLNARVPGAYREKELLMRNIISKSLIRGKIDFNLFVEITGEHANTKINKPIVNKYIEQLKNITEADTVDLLKMAIRMPDALKTQKEEIDKEEFDSILDALNTALTAINKYRTDEGNALKIDFTRRIKNISELLHQVTLIDPERIKNVKIRLNKAISELQEQVDKNRFEQEIIYYLEKYDITEEKVRLTNHLSYFIEALNSKESNGKKLGFISQEIGREVNTIGSKSNYAPMQKLVVQMKDELEKIKEQALNVL